jgi:DedD protein
LASQTPDDGFHEIQLNGKQLVFLFMAATVVSVVIFLSGVLVGRGVRAERAASTADPTIATIEPAPPAAPVAAPPAGSDPTAAPAPPTVDDLSYFDRLEKKTQPAEGLKPAAADANRPASARQASAASAPVPAPAPPVTAPAALRTLATTTPKPQPDVPSSRTAATALPVPAGSPVASAPAGEGYVIQVAALREHSDADAIASRLSSKGYSAFVMAPGEATPTMYRVRVGKFKTKREAEAVASKLQKEEQFKPWITR